MLAIKRLLLRRRFVREAKRVRDAWRERPVGDVRRKYPPGHFYSPEPNLDEIRARADEIFSSPDEIPGIDLRVEDQLTLVRQLAEFYDEQPFPETRREGYRYHFENIFFGYGDALMLYAMLRHLRPNRLIEIGSGYSSSATLDVSQRFLDGRPQCTFIEPHPKRLLKLLRHVDRERHEVIEKPVQAVDPTVFDRLHRGDVLFIDSTHVSKIGSDVNRVYFEILPRLRPGVMIHVHDIFYPFEYPPQWVFEGRSWNEAYLLRALLTHSSAFRIRLFNSYLGQKHADEVGALMPLWRRNTGGSIWLERVAHGS